MEEEIKSTFNKITIIITKMIKEDKIKKSCQKDLIFIFKSIECNYKKMVKNYMTLDNRVNLLSLENSKLIEKIDKAKNLGFIE